MPNNSRIKIFISSHKNTDYVYSDIFLPVQVGAGLPGRKKLEGFATDNTGENISDKNARFCELTTQYWAWKNQDVDYYGFFHYRRYLAFNTKYSKKTTVWGTIEEQSLNQEVIDKYNLNDKQIKRIIKDYDIILPEAKDITAMPSMGKNIREQYCGSGYLHAKDLDIMLDVLEEKYPEFMPYAKKYLSGKMSYLNNMFIMRKDIFEKYNEWLFDILFECDKRIDYTDYSVEAIRTPGHLAERLLNIYIAYLKDKHDYKIKELPTVVLLETDPFPELKPAFKENNVAIALSANDFYVPYVATVLTSIRENSTKNHNYDIFVMNKDITENSKRRLQSIFKDKKNFSLRFVSISRFESKFKPLFLRGHFTIETWFRLLMPEIMPEYDKVLYLDSDLAVDADVAELYKTDIKGYLLAACRDADTAGLYNGFEPSKKDYMDNILKIEKPYDYFQAGVILFNLDEFRKNFKTDEMLKYAGSYEWQLLDQDVLNNLAQGRVKFVDMAWNVMTDWRGVRIKDIISHAPKYLQNEYMKSRENTKIYHFAGNEKPWDFPDSDFAEKFWQYARLSDYYELILSRMNNKKPLSKREKVKNIAKAVFPEKTKRGKLVRRVASKVR